MVKVKWNSREFTRQFCQMRRSEKQIVAIEKCTLEAEDPKQSGWQGNYLGTEQPLHRAWNLTVRDPTALRPYIGTRQSGTVQSRPASTLVDLGRD